MNRKAKNDRKVAQSIIFMSQHLDEPVKITQLAKMANLSSSYFWALFKQKTGYAPIDFFIRLRMHQACYLLNSTNRKVKDIAAALGYKDPLYFSRLFKSVHGVAPNHYRVTVHGAVDRAFHRDGHPLVSGGIGVSQHAVEEAVLRPEFALALIA